MIITDLLEYCNYNLHYNKETGDLWKLHRFGNRYSLCSTLCHGHIIVSLNKTRYYAHQLIWLMNYGYFPEKEIDHINTIRTDNRLSNLREATKQQNAWNRGKPKSNTSGYKGVSLNKDTGKFAVYININKKSTYLGLYKTKEEASAVYEKKAKEIAGEYYKE